MAEPTAQNCKPLTAGSIPAVASLLSEKRLVEHPPGAFVYERRNNALNVGRLARDEQTGRCLNSLTSNESP